MSHSALLAVGSFDAIEFEKAVVRRLQAALTPSLIPPPHHPDNRTVVDTVAELLTDDRVQAMLAGMQEDRFVGVVRAAEEVLSRRHVLGDEETIAQLWEFIDEDDLNAMLATATADEQPEELLIRMFEGPYRSCTPKH